MYPFIKNSDLEKMSIKEKKEYFIMLKNYISELGQPVSKKNIYHEIITKIYPLLRKYDYEIIGEENVPVDRDALFVCNHSNSHDFFTAHEIFKKLGTNVAVFSASDDLDSLTTKLFKLCGATLIDRNDPTSINEGVIEATSNLIAGVPEVIFGESTWNLHPYKPMQQIKIGSVLMAAISEKPIVPTIFEYVENNDICKSEAELYSKCLVKFTKPIKISRNKSLIDQTIKIQKIMEEERIKLWQELGISKNSLDDVNKDVYLNHTYLKKFKAFAFVYDSLSESKFLFSKDNLPVENEYYLDDNGNFVPGITTKEKGKVYLK